MSASVKVCVVGWGRDGRWIVVDACRPSVGKVSDGAGGCDEEVCLMGGGLVVSRRATPGMRWRRLNPTLRTAMAALGWG